MQTVETDWAEIPALGFGTFQLDGSTCREAVETALAAGYRHVDTAEYYDNEQAVGAALDAASVDREDVFLTTKVWRSNLRHDDVLTSAEASLERLDVEYVDLLLMHWPHPRVSFAETLDAMAQLRERGLVRHVGVSNFTAEQLREAIAVSDVPIVTNQVQYHPFVDQDDLLDLCGEEGIALTAYSPLARGAALEDDIIREIAARHGKTPAQVTLRWLRQQDGVVAIPRSSTPAHIEANRDVFDFELTESEMARIHDRTGGLSIRLQNKLPSLVRSLPL